jgi:hypothetical protein
VTPFEKSWLGVPIVVVAWAAVLIWQIRGKTESRKLAWSGAVLFGLGSALIIPAFNDHSRTPLIVAAAITTVVGAVLYLYALIVRRV